jgi:hypothetical protein
LVIFPRINEPSGFRDAQPFGHHRRITLSAIACNARIHYEAIWQEVSSSVQRREMPYEVEPQTRNQ